MPLDLWKSWKSSARGSQTTKTVLRDQHIAMKAMTKAKGINKILKLSEVSIRKLKLVWCDQLVVGKKNWFLVLKSFKCGNYWSFCNETLYHVSNQWQVMYNIVYFLKGVVELVFYVYFLRIQFRIIFFILHFTAILWFNLQNIQYVNKIRCIVTDEST